MGCSRSQTSRDHREVFFERGFDGWRIGWHVWHLGLHDLTSFCHLLTHGDKQVVGRLARLLVGLLGGDDYLGKNGWDEVQIALR